MPLLAPLMIALPLAGLAQTITSGSIDGVPIPARVFEVRQESLVTSFVIRHHAEPTTEKDREELESEKVKSICGRLSGAITSAARDEQKKRLGISVTDQDIADARQTVHKLDSKAEWKMIHDRTVAITTALSQVYDQGKNPNDVYERVAKPAGIDPNAWALYLHVGKTKQAREKLAAPLKFSADSIAKAQAGMNVRFLAENAKLDKRIDDILAAKDPNFRQALEARRPHYPVPPLGSNFPGYVNEKRREWWLSQFSTMNVWLSDASLYTTCHLSKMGIHAPGER